MFQVPDVSSLEFDGEADMDVSMNTLENMTMSDILVEAKNLLTRKLEMWWSKKETKLE